ncbi:uncharacterized protein [Anabrus simplex]|uniref:uncharacterized protein n=1 Tax=Anabrus simplex TaxID=316456 RepID=UPI0034DD06D8
MILHSTGFSESLHTHQGRFLHKVAGCESVLFLGSTLAACFFVKMYGNCLMKVESDMETLKEAEHRSYYHHATGDADARDGKPQATAETAHLLVDYIAEEFKLKNE